MAKHKKSEMVVEVPVADVNEAEYTAEVTASMLPDEPVEEVPELAGSAEPAAPEATLPVPVVEAAPIEPIEAVAPVVVFEAPKPPASLNPLLAMLLAHGVTSPEVTQVADGSWLITSPVDHVFNLRQGPYDGGCTVLSISIKTLDHHKNMTLEVSVRA